MRKLVISIASSILLIPSVCHAGLVINELMQSNIDCIMDDLNEFPDSWVELYNAGSSPVSLAEYSLGTSEKLKKAYQLPDVMVAPGHYALVFCDKVGAGLHASFRLESGKDGNLYLFHAGSVADSIVSMKKQPAPNIAFGRITDGADEWGYQATPTPGAANPGVLCREILDNPIFSVNGKIFSESFNLTLSVPDGAPEGTVVRYTLDGTEPTANSRAYSGSIRISSSTVVRAALFCEGWLSPRSLTHSYINHTRDVTLPVVSVVTDQRYFSDSKIGIYVDGSYHPDPNIHNYQFDWRRPVNFEYFDDDSQGAAINQLCETRVKGGASRGNPLKSLVFYANKRFGEKRFIHEFFPDQTPGISEFKSFEMRNSGNDFDYMYMRDAVIQQSMGLNADLDWQPSRPAIFYINGVYKGIMNIRTRSNEDYIYSFYDGLEDIDMFENWYELKEGSWDNYNAFKNFYTGKGHSFSEFSRLMDVEEFCNLMIMELFFDNKDFPGNNIVMWRPVADGGRWRWVAKDTDFGMGLYGERADYPTLNWVTTPGYDNDRNSWANSADASRLFRRLLDTPEFRDMFIDRAAVYLGSFLSADEIISLVDRRYSELKYEYKFHRALFNPWWPDYAQEIEWARTWTRTRVPFFYRHMADFFSLSAPVPLTVNPGESHDRCLVVNGVSIASDEFDGQYYPGRRLSIRSLPAADTRHVIGWNVTVVNGSNTHAETYPVETLDIEMPQAARVVVRSILSDDPGAVDAVVSPDSSASEYFDLSGRSLGSPDPASLNPGVYVIRQGSQSRKVLVR